MNHKSPLNVAIALKRMEGQFSGLISKENWCRVSEQVEIELNLIGLSKNPIEIASYTSELITLLAQFPSIRDRINTEVEVQAILHDFIDNDLSKIVIDANLGETDLNLLSLNSLRVFTWSYTEEPMLFDEVNERQLILNPGGVDGGKSIKFSNMHIDFGEMCEIAAGAMLVGYEMIEKPNPLIIAAGILLTIRAITKAMTISISEQEASVFWGVINVRDKLTNVANQDEILEKTNQERRIIGLKALSMKEGIYSLNKLKILKVIRMIDNKKKIWKLVESFKITNS